jgi:hypothetical protein
MRMTLDMVSWVVMVSRKLKRQSHEAAIKLGESLSILDETLSGLRVIKAFLAEKLLRGRFHSANDELFHVRKKMGARRDLASPLTTIRARNKRAPDGQVGGDRFDPHAVRVPDLLGHRPEHYTAGNLPADGWWKQEGRD